MHVAVSTGAQDGLAAADARSFDRALRRLTCSEIRWLLAFVRLPVARQGPVGQHVVHDRSLSGVFLAASEQVGVPSHLLATGPTWPGPPAFPARPLRPPPEETGGAQSRPPWARRSQSTSPPRHRH